MKWQELYQFLAIGAILQTLFKKINWRKINTQIISYSYFLLEGLYWYDFY